jgi:hypothetical protein
MMLHENGRPTVMVEVMGQLMCDGKSGKQGSTDLCAQAGIHTRNVFHIHLTEDVGEELHAMVVIDGHELIILLLSNLMADALTIDDRCHAVFGFALGILLDFALFIPDWLNLDVIDIDFTTMLSLTIPCLALIEFIEGIAVNMSNGAVFWF